MATKVVNRCFNSYEAYIGRGTPAGNPYVIGRDGTREEVVLKFQRYFNKMINENESFKRYIMGLKGKTIGCSCRPKEGFQEKLLCHGQIIAGYLDNIPPEEVK